MIKSSAHRAPEAVHGTRRVAMRGRNKREARLARMSHGRPNEVSLRLKWLHKPVQCSCLCLRRSEIELCESRSSRQGPAPAPRRA